jgi:hypothetical protein
VVPGIGSLSSLRAVVVPRSARSSSSASCNAASVSYDGGAVTDSTRERTSANPVVLTGNMSDVSSELGDKV